MEKCSNLVDVYERKRSPKPAPVIEDEFDETFDTIEEPIPRKTGQFEHPAG